MAVDGGQEVGSVWGHGAYIAPDWSADWLHREATWLANYYAEDAYALGYEALDVGQRASVEARVQEALRTNTYDSATGDVLVGEPRADAIEAVAAHYIGLFGSEVSLNELRDAYAIAPDAIPDPERRRLLTAFFFWASWSCSAERPGKDITYTNNWPPDELVGNRPTTAILVWSIVSVFLLLAGIGALAWYFAVQRHAPEEDSDVPATDPLLGLQPTPSMRATLKYFWIVTAMFVVQIGFGAVTAHYGVEGTGFYGIPIAEWLPQAVSRTWHTQLGIFWIATAWDRRVYIVRCKRPWLIS